jgi:hypothetical protein
MIKMPGDRLEKKRIEDINLTFEIDPPQPKLKDRIKSAFQSFINKFKTPKNEKQKLSI